MNSLLSSCFPKSLLLVLVLGCFATGSILPAAEAPRSSAAVDSGWHTIGRISSPQWDGKSLNLHGDQGVLSVTPLSDDVVRVRFVNARNFGRDHSYAVVKNSLGPATAHVQTGTDQVVLRTANLRVTVHENPLRIEFADAAGEVLDSDDSQRGTAFAGSAFQVAKTLRGDEHVYGLGEKNGKLDKRGWILGGYSYAMWNSDTYAYDSSTDPIYVSVPFYLVVRRGRAHGIFLDNTFRSTFDIGRQRQDLLTFGAEGGELNYYFINGPKPAQVVERFTCLTGHMPLPPLWSLGFNQCRYSYYPESRVRLLANTFREKKVPADVIWLDIQYQDGFKPFTWNRDRFPDPARLVKDLLSQGFRTVVIVDAHPKEETGYAPYDSGLAGDYFVKRPDGSVYEGPVWPSQAERNPGPSVFPDFSLPAARDWWGSLYRMFTDIGVAGIWNDMNEPSVFVPPTGTMPLNVVHNNEGQPTDHREIHNVYGQLMSRSTFEGLSRLKPNERPFVLTRASFAGGQRYAAVWPGDNTADWTTLRQSLSTLLGLGVSGFCFVGSDISGFVRPASAELYTRWLQTGVFYPFMRSHTDLGTPDKEPWSFGYQFEPINRRAIELRYQLLPYIYNVMQQSSESGLPAMRPLFLEFPDDEATATIDDEFLFGADLLVAPVIWEGVSDRAVYLPPGDWYDYWSGRHFPGGTTIHVPVTLDSVPMFVRGGAFIFRQPVVQYTGQMPGNALKILVAPAGDSSSVLYEDDGQSLDYQRGLWMKRRFHQARENQLVTLEVSAPEGNYRPATRDLIFELWSAREPASVSSSAPSGDSRPTRLPHVDAAALAKAPRGWAYADGVVTVKDRDALAEEKLVVQYENPATP